MIAGGVGLVWGALRGSDDLLHSFVLGLWIGGAAMVGIAALTGSADIRGHPHHDLRSRDERSRDQHDQDRLLSQYRGGLGEDLAKDGSGMVVILVAGITLVAVGIGIDVLQRR